MIQLLQLQSRATYVVTNSSNDQTSLPLISQLGQLANKEMIDFERACAIYKALNGLTPPYMQSMFLSSLETAPSLATFITILKWI